MALAAAASGALRAPNTLFRVPPILTAMEEMSPNLPVIPSKSVCPMLHAVCARLPAASPRTPFRPSTIFMAKSHICCFWLAVRPE